MKYAKTILKGLAAVGTSGFLLLASLSQVKEDKTLTTGLGRINTPASPELSPKGNAKVLATYGKLPLTFEANQGQTDDEVRFLARGGGYSVFFTPSEMVLTLQKSAAPSASQKTASIENLALMRRPQLENPTVLRMKLIGAKTNPKITGLEEQPGKVNYFIGNDPERWRTNIPTHAKVKYEEIYPGIDLVCYGNQRQLEYDFVVEPGADPSTIRIEFSGAEKVELASEGDLILYAAGGQIRQRKPLVYQEVNGVRKEISAGYVRKGKNQVSFELGDYDATQSLVIDPVLIYSTYLGGRYEDYSSDIAADSSGVYVVGTTNSPDFPVTNRLVPWETVTYIVKLNTSGTAIIYSTYVGSWANSGDFVGLGYEGIQPRRNTAPDLAVDSSGNAYVAASGIVPVINGFQSAPKTQLYDGFILKLSSTGSEIIYSTYLGGSHMDFIKDVAVDGSGSAYVTGVTYSDDLPTVNAFQPRRTPSPEDYYFGELYRVPDAFVAKIDPTGSALTYCSYLGGQRGDQADAIAVDYLGHAYVTWGTSTRTGSSVVVTKIDPSGGSVVYSTVLGPGRGIAIATDRSGNAYVAGWTTPQDDTYGTPFPTTPGAFQPRHSGFSVVPFRYSVDSFITKLNATGSRLVYSSFLGGTHNDYVLGLALDDLGNAYLTGVTYSTDFPIARPLQPANAGSFDAFITRVNAEGSALVYSTYFGGIYDEWGAAIAVDSSGNTYVTGGTSSPDFPTTLRPNPAVFDLGRFVRPTAPDVFVLKIWDNLPPIAKAKASPNPAECTGSGGANVTFDGSDSHDPDGDALNFKWRGIFGTSTGKTINARLPLGTHTIELEVDDGNGNTAFDRVKVKVQDTTPPTILSLSAAPNILWPPNHAMVAVTVSAFASDICHATADCRIASVSSNEPIDGLGDGDRAPDWVITGNLTVSLRAERSGTGSGRVYSITVKCTDTSGNSATKIVTVTVPRDQGKN